MSETAPADRPIWRNWASRSNETSAIDDEDSVAVDFLALVQMTKLSTILFTAALVTMHWLCGVNAMQ